MIQPPAAPPWDDHGNDPLHLPKQLLVQISARTLVSQHRVPKSGLWKGFSGAPTAAKAAVGYLALIPPVHVELRPLGKVQGEEK